MTKAVAKKAAPARKKAVAKKAAPARKKAVAKKAAPARKKAEAKYSLQEEQGLPVFDNDVKSGTFKSQILPHNDSKKKSRKVLLLGAIAALLLLGISVLSLSPQLSTETKSDLNEKNESISGDGISKEPVAEKTKPTPRSSKSSIAEKPKQINLNSLAPRNFESTAINQVIYFSWSAPADPTSVIGYELSVKKAGTENWVVINTVTPEQLRITVDLVSLNSASKYRLASILENGDMAFNRTVLDHDGVAN